MLSEIPEANRHLFEIALEDALKAGMSWVVFNDQPEKELRPESLRFFPSETEAEAYKEDANGEDDIVEQFFNFDRYICLKVTTLQRSLEPDQFEPKLIGDIIKTLYPEHYQNNFLTTKNLKTMNQASYEYNKTQLKNLGFGEEIAEPLLKKMDQNLDEFTLNHSRKFGKDEVQSVLHFSKGDDLQKDLTFLNRFDATLKQEGKEDLSQTFFVGQKYNYTLQERYNMMEGRAVYREQPVMRESESETGKRFLPTGETYFAWRALDFKNADQYGNFLPKTIRWDDHAKELDRYPVMGIEENYIKQRLVNQLQKGNKVDVTVQKDGQEIKAKLMVNAPMLRLDFQDENGQKLDIKKGFRQTVEQTQTPTLSPQEVQRAAIAKAAEEKAQGQQNGQTPESPGQSQSAEKNQQQMQGAAMKENAQQQEQNQRRKQGVRV